MPFTVSHASAALPLKILQPRWFSLTGLMAGAMSPDLLYFLMAQTTYRGVSHSWLGLVIFCLPAGVAFSFAFHLLFKEPLINHLPWLLERRLSGLADHRFRVRSARAWIVLVSSVLIGALSHFFWDSLTHGTGEIAGMLPILNEQYTLFGFTRSLCRYLQHLSTIAGAVALLIYVIKGSYLPPPTIAQPRRRPLEKLRFWFGVVVAASAFACLVVYCFDRIYGLNVTSDVTQYAVVSGFGLAGWAGFFYYCCIIGLRARRRK
jgi:hypothetical protein